MACAHGRRSPHPRVTVTIEAGVADVRLNRPEKLNALDPAMFDALVEAGSRLAGDPSVRAVVLSGEGRGFCSGLDFASFQAMAGPSRAESGGTRRGSAHSRAPGRITNHGQQAAFVWTELPVPVIAAVHGVALGGGLQIALARRPAHRGPRRPPVGPGDPLGPDPRHDRHPHAAPAGAARRGQGADVDRAHGLG